MLIKDIQIVYAKMGVYKGAIDGDFGLKSQTARHEIEKAYRDQYAFSWNLPGCALPHKITKRRNVASVQACLNHLGFEAGAMDGYEGHNTREALAALLYKAANGKAEYVRRKPNTSQPKTTARIPRQKDVREFYGDPGSQVPNRLKTIVLPFKFRIDYNLAQRTNKVTVHKLAAPSLEKALLAVYDHYGPDEMRELGIDRYAGAYNKRKMRGGKAWSMHAYGCAIDFFALPNGLRARCPEAKFCWPEYKEFLDIMERHGWLPAIRLWGADAMHFQRAKL